MTQAHAETSEAVFGRTARELYKPRGTLCREVRLFPAKVQSGFAWDNA
ncbi:hypothetical protein CEV31_1053 [Brucella thiophenivorans]|uniref:Uncharacterized protein n=1 Tax=Brucella thiophenivorans TaxID=571255 RepID=A0A256G123_9HYPH|nr:hypothetical protein CEV31_1053 [Brucella thiophenivorans]